MAKQKREFGSMTEMMEFFRETGRQGGILGGPKGGNARAAKLTPEERSAIAKKAAAASAKVRSKKAKAKKQAAGKPARKEKMA